ncbi:MAG TPA: zinc-binding dehydrogenase [Abditibacteriaceae bacterium]|nr:zinc-binding dehydrogenase [Abditibacteriaceae bacterium]
MKYVQLLGDSQIAVQERPRPSPKRGEVLIQTVVSALCGSEMKSYRTIGYDAGNVGHEAAGIVAELGQGVTTLQIGQRVGVSTIAGCGACEYCHKGQYTWCDDHKFYDNMHAEYFVAAALACHVLPDDVSWDVGVLITGDGMGVPYHTSRKIAADDIEHVAGFGLGPVGLGHVLMQKYLGRRVIGIDRSSTRLQLARELGAASIIAVEENSDVAFQIRVLTQGRGADVCIEAAGVPATVHYCFDSVRKGGIVVFNGEQGALELSPSSDFIRRDITAVGSWFYHFHEYKAMLDLFRRGLPVASLITHRLPLAQAADAYRAMEGESGKVLLTYSQ